MELGAFSVSLTVRDLRASQQFYEKLGLPPSIAMRTRDG